MVNVATVLPLDVVKVGAFIDSFTPGLALFSAQTVVLLMVEVVINSLKVTDIVGLVLDIIPLGGLGVYEKTVGGVVSGGATTVNVVVLWANRDLLFLSLIPVLAQAVY